MLFVAQKKKGLCSISPTSKMEKFSAWMEIPCAGFLGRGRGWQAHAERGPWSPPTYNNKVWVGSMMEPAAGNKNPALELRLECLWLLIDLSLGQMDGDVHQRQNLFFHSSALLAPINKKCSRFLHPSRAWFLCRRGTASS